MKEMLSVDKITKTYKGSNRPITAAREVSLTVRQGSMVALRGPSGSGKTTVMLCAGGLLAPDSGTVLLDGETLYAISAARRCGLRAGKIGFVFQQFNLIPYLTAYENVVAPGLALKKGVPRQSGEELLDRFGMSHRMGHLPHGLSTGERQRVALARALFNNPVMLFADEPTGNLDDENAASVLGYLRDFAEQGGGVLLVTHDTRAAEFADRTYFIENGSVIAEQESPNRHRNIQ